MYAKGKNHLINPRDHGKGDKKRGGWGACEDSQENVEEKYVLGGDKRKVLAKLGCGLPTGAGEQDVAEHGNLAYEPRTRTCRSP